MLRLQTLTHLWHPAVVTQCRRHRQGQVSPSSITWSQDILGLVMTRGLVTASVSCRGWGVTFVPSEMTRSCRGHHMSPGVMMQLLTSPSGCCLLIISSPRSQMHWAGSLLSVSHPKSSNKANSIQHTAIQQIIYIYWSLLIVWSSSMEHFLVFPRDRVRPEMCSAVQRRIRVAL